MAFTPSPSPIDPKDLGRWMFEEMRRLSEELNTQQEVLRLQATNAAPAKPREGDIRLANAPNWDPGAGDGFYGYYGGAWVKLG